MDSELCIGPTLPQNSVRMQAPHSDMQLVFVGVYALAYGFYLRRAFKDHAALPYCRYRLSNMCIRMQVWQPGARLGPLARVGVAART